MTTIQNAFAVRFACVLMLSIAFGAFADESQRPPAMPIAPTDGVVSSTYGPYVYDPSGNIVTIGSDVPAANTYIYDPMSRLTSATVIHEGYPQSQTYEYDVYGNRIKAGLENYPVTSSTNHLSSMNAQYDPAGNLIRWQPPGSAYIRSYDYDALNMMTREKITTASGERSVVHIYTADDERYWSMDTFTDGSNVGRWTVRNLDGKMLRVFTNDRGTWQSTRDYLYRDGQLLASITGTTTYHYSMDHLGTPRIVSGASGYEVSRRTYFPFGAELTSVTEHPDGPLRFTGHERDMDLNNETLGALDYMHARYYTSRAGRFMTLDPLLGQPGAPQSWNRFSYVWNMPLSFADPNGLCGESEAFVGPTQPCDIGFGMNIYVWGETVYFTGVWGNMYDSASERAARVPRIADAPCPMFVPIAPPNANLDQNIAEAETHRPAIFAEYQWFKSQVGPWGPQDYKRIDRKYEPFGNFNYGAVGAAMGIPDEVLKRAAGYYQSKANRKP